MNTEESLFRHLQEKPDDLDALAGYVDALKDADYSNPRAELVNQELQAAEILGHQNVHGILSAQSFFGKLPEEVIRQIVAKPVPREILEQCKDHILVFYPGYSLSELSECARISCKKRKIPPEALMPDPFMGMRHGVPFLYEEGEPAYLLVPKAPFADLFGFSHQEQLARLEINHPEYRSISAAELSCALLLHEHATKERLLENVGLKTNDYYRDPDFGKPAINESISLGNWLQAGGLGCTISYSEYASDQNGLAACRKL